MERILLLFEQAVRSWDRSLAADFKPVVSVRFRRSRKLAMPCDAEMISGRKQ
jgi:hypothetical protein